MRRIFSIVLISILLFSCSPSVGETPKPTATSRAVLTVMPQSDMQVLPKTNRPNILFILTDDLDADLNTIDYMPHLHEIMTSRGLTINDFFITNSLCCPSRSTFLRGQYTHNHGVLGNDAPQGGFERFYNLKDESSTMATWLQAAGYRTVLLGKYLNGYPFAEDRAYIPPGWTEWYSPAKGRPYVGFKYTLNENGSFVDYDDHGQQPSQYMTDVLAQKTVDFIKRSSADAKPFFIYLSTYAPHAPARPAPRHAELFPGLKAPRTPSFNEADVSDKPAGTRDDPLLAEDQIAKIDETYRSRVQSMQAVDEMLVQLINTLKETGQLDNTYIIFTSDNGYHLGQHRLLGGKGSPYDEDLRVPFVIRGPGIEPDTSLDGYITGNVDIAPTFAELAGVIPPAFVDGRSLVPLFSANKPPVSEWRLGYLIEFYGYGKDESASIPESTTSSASMAGLLEPLDSNQPLSTDPEYLGLRTSNYLYVEYNDDFRELYDLQKDPYEMENIAGRADPALVSQLSKWLHALSTCSGNTCKTLDMGLNQ